VKFGFCYIPDYHEELHGDYPAWYRRLLSEWRVADSLGYDCIWIAEHRVSGYAFCSTPVMAQAIVDHTQRIRVGTAIALLSHRHPLLTAEHWAAVDVLSGGRLNFGIGRGISGYDFQAIGVPSSESRPRFEEAWEIVRRLWTEDAVTYEGKFWSIRDHQLRPQPVQRPTPPIYVAAIATPESYVWAGANGFHIMTSPFLLDSTERQRKYLDMYRQALDKAGHDPAAFEVLGNYHLCIVEREEMLGSLDQYIFRYLKFVEGYSRGITRVDPVQYAAWVSGLSTDVTEMRERRAVVGTPQQCIDRIGELSEACGLTGWMFHVNYGGTPHGRVIDQMELFAREVVPSFNAAGPSRMA
jgi:alkanesulfonate monooxygenase SsuD/methylene tetrahydromethanopterin reductase-like flavin-dependent oxidoreductase (luciferase family)